jgi:phosphoglycolate phosphatase
MTTPLIALDLDGTLEDSRADMVAAIHRVRTRFDLAPRADDAVRPWVSRGMDNLYRHCFDELLTGGDARYDAIRRAYEADYLAHVADTTQLYDGIADVLPALTDRAWLACVTNKPEHISRALLEELGIHRAFRTVVGGDSCAAPKPDPIMLRTAVVRIDHEGPVFMCGDSNGDMVMGKAYGATRVWCAWGYYDALKEPFDRRLDHPTDLVRLLS